MRYQPPARRESRLHRGRTALEDLRGLVDWLAEIRLAGPEQHLLLDRRVDDWFGFPDGSLPPGTVTAFDEYADGIDLAAEDRSAVLVTVAGIYVPGIADDRRRHLRVATLGVSRLSGAYFGLSFADLGRNEQFRGGVREKLLEVDATVLCGRGPATICRTTIGWLVVSPEHKVRVADRSRAYRAVFDGVEFGSPRAVVSHRHDAPTIAQHLAAADLRPHELEINDEPWVAADLTLRPAQQ